MLDEIKIPSPNYLLTRSLLWVLVFSVALMGAIGYWLTRQQAILPKEVYFTLAIFPLLLVFTGFLMYRQIKHTKLIYETSKLQNENYKLTLNNLSQGLITTDKHGRVHYMNSSAEKLTGWTILEAKKMPLHKVYEVVNEETGSPFEHIVSRILKHGDRVEVENNTILKRKDTQQLIIENNGIPIRDARGNVLGAVLMFTDITHSKKMKDELDSSEKKFRDLIENLPVAVYTCDAGGNINVYNKAAVDLWGTEPAANQTPWGTSWQLSPAGPFDLPLQEKKKISAQRNTEPGTGSEIIIHQPNGAKRQVIAYHAPLFKECGKISGAVNLLVDITSLREKEQHIIKSEEKYRSLFEQAGEAILIYSFDGTISEFNSTASQLLGYTRQEFNNLKLTDILVGEIIINPSSYALIMAGESVTLYRQLKRKDGVLLEAELKVRKLADGRILAFGRDVTDRKMAEDRMKKAIDRYDFLARATSDTIWDWDMIDDKISFNEGVRTMFGYEMKELNKEVGWWKSNIHPEDWRVASRLLQDAVAQKQQSVQMEYRFRCSDASFKYIDHRTLIIYGPDQLPSRMIGAMQDISYKKENEIRMSKAILDAQEKERQQIGMELHDNINQILSAAVLYLGMAKNAEKEKDEFSESVATGMHYINDAIAEIRRLSHQLAPVSYAEVSLKDVFESLTANMNRAQTFSVTLHFDELEKEQISSDIQINLYRILQEQLNNVIKHSQASEVKICVWLVGPMVQLRIADNGKGCDPQMLKNGIGLHNIKKRVEVFSGEFSFTTSPGNGFALFVEIPFKRTVFP